MTRRPLMLTFALAAAAAAALVGRHFAEPAPPDPPPWGDGAESYPETVPLRYVAKRQIAREVAAGARPLVEAATLFGELDRLPPATYPAYHAALPGRTEEERLCREVIQFVHSLEDEFPQAAAAVARLEGELRSELGRDGGVRLPDPASLPPAVELLEQARAGMTEAERRAVLPAGRGGPPGGGSNGRGRAE
ncbi:MAG TPA: hypothetical protein VKE40_04105 [Gemmataceae bacterium]|nr:hypothetical protein [Gemmataceae bacterium]